MDLLRRQTAKNDIKNSLHRIYYVCAPPRQPRGAPHPYSAILSRYKKVRGGHMRARPRPRPGPRYKY